MGNGGGGGGGRSRLCPQCGHRGPHERGTPCREKTGPKCNVPLVRDFPA